MAPLPKRIEERRRVNIVPGEAVVVMAGAVVVPELPKRGIHPAARAWYDSLRVSGQSQFYEPSDWAMAVAATMVLSKALRPSGNAAMIGAAWSMIDALLTTETGRRRAHVQVRRTGEVAEPEKPRTIDDYRKALEG